MSSNCHVIKNEPSFCAKTPIEFHSGVLVCNQELQALIKITTSLEYHYKHPSWFN